MATENNKNIKYSNRNSLTFKKRKLMDDTSKNSIQTQFNNFLNLIKIKHLS